MHRKLATHKAMIRTFLGLALSLATTALIVAGPAPGTGDSALVRDAVATPVAVAPQAKAGSAKAHSRHRRAQAREAMALPFFSFAQGLRSGNRS